MALEEARELAHLPPHERARLAFEAERLARGEPAYRALRRLAWFAVVAAAAGCASFPWLARVDGRVAMLLPVGLTSLGAAGLTAHFLLAGRLQRRHLRDALLLDDIPPAACFACSAGLRGITAAVCPTCGATIRRESATPPPGPPASSPSR